MGTCIKFFTSHISHTPCISTLSSLVDQKGGIVVRPVPTEYVLILSALLVTHPPGSGSTLPAESCQFDLIINARARYELSHPHFSSVEGRGTDIWLFTKNPRTKCPRRGRIDPLYGTKSSQRLSEGVPSLWFSKSSLKKMTGVQVLTCGDFSDFSSAKLTRNTTNLLMLRHE